jgi:molybdenum cofactor cytidylyltransferase
MTARNEPKIGGILLAAGGSSRMGRPKQLLNFQGKTLLRILAETLAGTLCRPLVAVLGAETERSTAELDGLPISICVNENWQSGMSSSIKSGIRQILDIESEINAVIIALCDQPHVTSDDIARLISAFTDSRLPIVAAGYNDTVGVPALLSRAMFDDLCRLEGDKGARELIRKNPECVLTIPMEKAAIDIDTPDDADLLSLS